MKLIAGMDKEDELIINRLMKEKAFTTSIKCSTLLGLGAKGFVLGNWKG
jgi:hypothetical protein